MIKNRVQHLKIGRIVKIISGAYKGNIGTVLTINTKKSIACIDSISPRIKRVKSKNSDKPTIKELKRFIHISNILPWDQLSGSSSRIGVKLASTEKKKYFKKSDRFLDEK